MIVVLDTGPLGVITSPNRIARETQAMLAWEQQMLLAGHFLLVPAIADYELRREHPRRGANVSIAELDRFVYAVEGRYLELTDSALKIAAQLWADTRNARLPTADLRELDCDIVIAAQVLDLSLPADELMVATGNIRHLARLVHCELWRNIIP